MAALGNLVAGVAHEINTPLGVSVTAASHLSDRVEAFIKQYQSGSLKRTELEALLEDAEESTTILSRNLERASNLVGNFKQIATDQTIEDIREFALKQYLSELSQSLSPQLRQGQHQVDISCDDSVSILSYPGALAQIFTNLIINSILHGFENQQAGKISITVEPSSNTLDIHYHDNGRGVSDEQRSNVFDPFYTTKRSEGGTGLGLHICYNLVTQKLRGTISCIPSDTGAYFKISLPRSLKA